MTNQVYTLSLGQAGNQIGFEFWKHLFEEHGIRPDGTFHTKDDFDKIEKNGSTYTSYDFDSKEMFFNKTIDNRYMPRALMVDLEPRVINSVQNSTYGEIFSSCCYIEKEGGGASNNWANGYTQGEKIKEELFRLIDEEIETCDNFTNFFVMHSTSGGTGSGLGSFLLEHLKDRYPKKNLIAFSVLPNQEDVSAVIIEPYNSLLTLRRLNTYADAVMLLDNTSLNRILSYHITENAAFSDINQTIAKQIGIVTTMLRYPGHLYHDFSWLLAQMVPMPRFNFLMTSLAPISDFSKSNNIKLNNVGDIMKSLKRSQNMLLYCHPLRKPEDRYMSILDFFQGEIEIPKIDKTISLLFAENLIKFVDWRTPSIQVSLSSYSPYLKHKSPVRGLMLANNTSVKDVFQNVLSQYSKLRNRKAFLDKYQCFPLFEKDFSEFDMAAEDAKSLVAEYKSALTSSFMT